MNEKRLRVCIYIKNGVRFTRRQDLEKRNSHIIILDVITEKTKFRLINLYRVFNTLDGTTPRQKFVDQLNCIKEAKCANLVVTGDFNLDESRRFMFDYSHRFLFEELQNVFEPLSDSTCKVSYVVESSEWPFKTINIRSCLHK